MALERVPEAVPERLPPHNVEAEESVLGAILLDREAIARVASFLRPEDFFRRRNAETYAAMLALYQEGAPIDHLTLADELQRRGTYDEVGGLPYLARLFDAVPTSAHVEHYARIVERTAVMRRLIQAAGRITQIGYQDNLDVDEALEKSIDHVLAVAQQRTTRDFQPLRVVLEEYFEHLQALHVGERDRYGVPTGFIDLDKITGGFQRSDLILLAARPSLGKTSLGLCFAANAALRFHQTTAIFSLEMSRLQLAARLLAMESGVDSTRLRLGQFNDAEVRRLNHALAVLAEAPVYLDDTPAISITELTWKAKALQLQTNVDLIIIDYLQLITTAGAENRVNEISHISRQLKRLARDLNVPVVALSQLSRAVESRTPHVPMLSDLRESGCLGGDTPVYLPEVGRWQPIADLVGQRGFSVLALDPVTGRLEPRPVLNAFATGRKPVFRLETVRGRSLRATANHRFFTPDGWRRLDQLAPGTPLASAAWSDGGRPARRPDHPLALAGGSPAVATSNPHAPALEPRAESPGLLWDEVRSLTPDGADQVYDLTVADLHSFVAADLVVHNSLEQDADVVLFIYRDDVYNKDSEKKGIAEIHIAKHRNGPTGVVNLLFLEKTTKFVDLEAFRA